jgi:hypothetical protein
MLVVAPEAGGQDPVVLRSSGSVREAVGDLTSTLFDDDVGIGLPDFGKIFMLWEGDVISDDEWIFEGSWRELTDKEMQELGDAETGTTLSFMSMNL